MTEWKIDGASNKTDLVDSILDGVGRSDVTARTYRYFWAEYGASESHRSPFMLISHTDQVILITGHNDTLDSRIVQAPQHSASGQGRKQSSTEEHTSELQYIMHTSYAVV